MTEEFQQEEWDDTIEILGALFIGGGEEDEFFATSEEIGSIYLDGEQLGDFWGSVSSFAKGAVKSVKGAVKEVKKAYGKIPVLKNIPPGAFNMAWAADALARKIPGYEAVRSGWMTPQMKAAADVMYSAGKLQVPPNSVVKQAASGAVSLSFPANSPVKEGLAVADRAVRTAEGVRGSPRQQRLMRKAIKNTVALAKRGDPAARKAADYMATAVKVRRAATNAVTAAAGSAAARTRGTRPIVKGARTQGGILVKRGGIVKRGNFIAT